MNKSTNNTNKVNGVKVNAKGKSNWITGTAIFNIVNAVILLCSWFIIADGGASFCYVMSWVALALNIVALVKAKKLGFKLWGSICCIVGSALSSLMMLLAMPALILTIVGLIGQWLQTPEGGQE